MNSFKGLLAPYNQGEYFCELLGLPNGSSVNPKTLNAIIGRLDKLNLKALRKRASAAERELYNLGITFTVYTDSQAIDRILPFDVVPRIISAEDFDIINRGVSNGLLPLMPSWKTSTTIKKSLRTALFQNTLSSEMRIIAKRWKVSTYRVIPMSIFAELILSGT